MAPESVSNIIALDLEWNNSRLECQVDRYDLIGDFLYVSWNAIECPENYVPVGSGVAFVWVPSSSVRRRYRARVDAVKDGFEWVDRAGDRNGAMVILTLPPNYVFLYPSEDSPEQPPVSFKSTEDSRMALYWWIQPGRFVVTWHMEDSPSTDIETQCRLLNEESRRRMTPNDYPVHVDRLQENIPSEQPQVKYEPPEWHLSIQVSDEATLVLGHQELVDLSREVKNVRQEKVISIGNDAQISAPVVIANNIENSFNTLMESDIDDDLKTLLDQLLKAVNELNKEVSQDKADEAKAMARDTEALVKEATSSKPRHRWYAVSLKGLKQAAINIGEVADPVLNIVMKLTPLLLA